MVHIRSSHRHWQAPSSLHRPQPFDRICVCILAQAISKIPPAKLPSARMRVGEAALASRSASHFPIMALFRPSTRTHRAKCLHAVHANVSRCRACAQAPPGRARFLSLQPARACRCEAEHLVADSVTRTDTLCVPARKAAGGAGGAACSRPILHRRCFDSFTARPGQMWVTGTVLASRGARQ